MMASIFVKVDTDDVMMILGQSGKNNYLWSTHSLSLVHAKNHRLYILHGMVALYLMYGSV